MRVNNQGSTESSEDHSFEDHSLNERARVIPPSPIKNRRSSSPTNISQVNLGEDYCGRKYSPLPFKGLQSLINPEETFSIGTPRTPRSFSASMEPVGIEEKASEDKEKPFALIPLKRKRNDAPSSQPNERPNKRQNINNRETWPQVNIMDAADIIELEIPSYEGSLEDYERGILNSDCTEVLFRVNRFAAGKQHVVWKPVDKYEGREVLIKTFNPLNVNENKRVNLAKDIMKGYALLKERNDVKVPELINLETYQTNGYFIWEFINGRKAVLADVKHIIIDMLRNMDIIEDFRPDNAIVTEDGSLFMIDPSWNDNNFDDLEISSLIEAWVCPYKADKISVKDYTEFMDDIQKLNLPTISPIWSTIKAKVDAKFYN